jgi:hypothetical protein
VSESASVAAQQVPQGRTSNSSTADFMRARPQEPTDGVNVARTMLRMAKFLAD